MPSQKEQPQENGILFNTNYKKLASFQIYVMWLNFFFNSILPFRKLSLFLLETQYVKRRNLGI